MRHESCEPPALLTSSAPPARLHVQRARENQLPGDHEPDAASWSVVSGVAPAPGVASRRKPRARDTRATRHLLGPQSAPVSHTTHELGNLRVASKVAPGGRRGLTEQPPAKHPRKRPLRHQHGGWQGGRPGRGERRTCACGMCMWHVAMGMCMWHVHVHVAMRSPGQSRTG